MTSCHTHAGASAAGTCRRCLHEFCTDCLVYSYGTGKSPYCIRCALVAASTRREPQLDDSLSA
jgi:hypothetical protein